jgi:acyl-CoA thioester hydrolase
MDLNVNHRVGDATLLEYVEACGYGVVAAHGWAPARMAAQSFAIILRRHQLENLAPAALDDELEIATWASDVKRVSATRHYTIRRAADGALLSRVDTLGVWVDLKSGRPIRIPSDFLADFAPNLVGWAGKDDRAVEVTCL